MTQDSEHVQCVCEIVSGITVESEGVFIILFNYSIRLNRLMAF